jgi:hypothetical protein
VKDGWREELLGSVARICRCQRGGGGGHRRELATPCPMTRHREEKQRGRGKGGENVADQWDPHGCDSGGMVGGKQAGW